jgi:DNA-3-methyladenine glycosylase
VPGWHDLLTRPVLEVAPALLGTTLSHDTDEGTVVVQLTEVEAYDGQNDPASHAYRGPTPRNEVMFGEAGRLYVYFSYGMHWCCNIVTGAPGSASAVLLRAGRVIEGADVARARRGERTVDRSLARGPACLAQALGLSRTHNGADLLDSGALRLAVGEPVGPDNVSRGPRVGVSLGHDVPWRFWVTGDATVSAYKRSPRAVD